MNVNVTRWASPFLEQGQSVYTASYGSDAAQLLTVLESAPYEIAVLSRLIAYLYRALEGGAEHGYPQDS